MAQVEQQILLEAPVRSAFRVITDYARYPEFLPEMQDVEILSRNDGVCTARFTLELFMRVAYTLRLSEVVENDASGPSVTWSLVEAKMMTTNTGAWHLAATAAGLTEATYALDVQLRGLIPKSVSSRLVGQTLPLTLQRFKARIESEGCENDK